MRAAGAPASTARRAAGAGNRARARSPTSRRRARCGATRKRPRTGAVSPRTTLPSAPGRFAARATATVNRLRSPRSSDDAACACSTTGPVVRCSASSMRACIAARTSSSGISAASARIAAKNDGRSSDGKRSPLAQLDRLVTNRAVLVGDRVHYRARMRQRRRELVARLAQRAVEVGRVLRHASARLAEAVAALQCVVHERRAVPVDDPVADGDGPKPEPEVRRERVAHVAEPRAAPAPAPRAAPPSSGTAAAHPTTCNGRRGRGRCGSSRR